MDFMYMMNYVDVKMTSGDVFNSDKIAKEFSDYLKTLSMNDFIDKIIFTGYIPDIYKSDSREETIYTKLVEVITSEWAIRMGFNSEYVKQKASYQDVNIEIKNKIIVCDSKSFRLGRSQAAPNVKDFLKLADIRKWLERYDKEKRLGGLVVYPCKHEWTNGSDAYQYCSTKDTPTIMLPYKYLAFLLKYADNYDHDKLIELWNFNRLFPKPLKNRNKNKKEYWNVINKEIVRITNTSEKTLKSFLEEADKIINEYVLANRFYLKTIIDAIKEEKRKQLDELDKELLEEMLLNLMIKQDTSSIESSITNINRFRISEEKEAE